MTPQPLFLFKILGIPFFSFTTLAVAGAALALLATVIRFQSEGRRAESAVESFAIVVFPALVAGRLVHLLYNYSYYAERPDRLLQFSDGGFAFVGVFVGGFAGLAAWSRWRVESLSWACDVAAFPVALCASCAWLGAFWHGSQYGAPAEHALALELRDSFGVVLMRTPTQLLGALWCAIVGLVTWASVRKWIGAGSSAPIFALPFGAGMFMLEFTRGDSSLYIRGLRLAQWLYLVLFVAGFLRLGRRYWRV